MNGGLCHEAPPRDEQAKMKLVQEIFPHPPPPLNKPICFNVDPASQTVVRL